MHFSVEYLAGLLITLPLVVRREPVEKAMTATMMAACVTGLVFISKANFMPGAGGKGGGRKNGLNGECA